MPARTVELYVTAFALFAVLGSCGDSIYQYQVPQSTGDGWSTASLADVGLDLDRDDPIGYILAKPAVHEPGTYWY